VLVVGQQDGVDPAHGISVQPGAGQLSATETWERGSPVVATWRIEGGIREQPNRPDIKDRRGGSDGCVAKLHLLTMAQPEPR
jgi:hypothetical protein